MASFFPTTGVGLCLGVSHLHSISLLLKLSRQEESLLALPTGGAEVCLEAWSLFLMGANLAKNGLLIE